MKKLGIQVPEDVAIVSRGHRNHAVYQQLDRFGLVAPPEDLILDRVELGEGAVESFRRGQAGVDLGRRDAVCE